MKNGELEKEIKVLNVNSSRLTKRIFELGGREIQNATTHMWWFDFGETKQETNSRGWCSSCERKYVIDSALKMTKSLRGTFCDGGAYFRVRREDTGYDLTLKYKINQTKNVVTNKEISHVFGESEFESVLEDLTAAGFKCIAKHEKKRKSFLLELQAQSVRVDIDEWPDLPTYAEIEGDEVNAILNAVNQLELGDKAVTNKIGVELFATYGIEFYSDQIFSNTD